MDRPKKVLIVEDETMTAMALASRLRDLGCAVIDLTATGEEAVRKAKAERPDIVFMDVNLPGDMDGIETAEIIAKSVPASIVFISGYSSKAAHDRAVACSPAAFLVKPFDFSAIGGILASIGDSFRRTK